MKKILIHSFLLLLFGSCTHNQLKIDNKKKGDLKATMKLVQIKSKKFILDNETAPRPQYIQVINDSIGNKQLTFLNNYNNAIYFYNYQDQQYIKKILFDKQGPNAVQRPMGYHIKNKDSIYIFSLGSMNILLANSKGIIRNTISLTNNIEIANSKSWGYTNPEYYVETVKPFIETSKELLLTGQFMGEIKESMIENFKFTAHIDFKSNDVSFSHTYPEQLYGDNIYWYGSFFTEVFPEIHHNGDQMIYSFPISHNLHIVDLKKDAEYIKLYAGSNFANTIHSFSKNPQKLSSEEVRSKFIKQDMYAAIIYDKYRKVYYRFLRKAMSNASMETSWKEKTISIILMDEQFSYMGETELGTENQWHWQNSFVTEEGLNIEAIEKNDIDEVYLNLKIFIPTKI